MIKKYKTYGFRVNNEGFGFKAVGGLKFTGLSSTLGIAGVWGRVEGKEVWGCSSPRSALWASGLGVQSALHTTTSDSWFGLIGSL